MDSEGTAILSRETEAETVVVRPMRVVWLLAAAMVLLVLASVAGQVLKYFFGHDEVGGLVRLFYIDAEANLPTWYSTVTLLLCAVLLAAIALHYKSTQNRQFFHWAGLSVLFLGLSADEAAQIHEISWRVTGQSAAIEKWFPAEWVALGLAFVLVVAVVYWKFLFSLPPKTRNLFIVAGILYVAGAAGLETVSWGAGRHRKLT
jgi:hypothetical protein